jgi:hypothetical protein
MSVSVMRTCRAQVGDVVDHHHQARARIGLGRFQGQAQRHERAAAGPVGQTHLPAGELDHVVDHRQPEARAALALGREERVERVFQRFRPEAGARYR